MPYEIAEPSRTASSGLDLEAVLAAVTGEPPCGPDLEYDPQLNAIERALRGADEAREGDAEPRVAIDWTDVRRRCESLLARSKDLRIAVAYLRALTRTEQLPGFAFGLQVIEGLTARYWNDLHPALEASDGGDQSRRLNALAGLAPPLGAWSRDSVLCDLRSALVLPPTGPAHVTVRDVVAVTGAAGVAGTALARKPSTVELTLRDASTRRDESTEAWFSAPRAALAALDALQARLEASMPGSPVPDLLPMRAMLQAVADALATAGGTGNDALQVGRPVVTSTGSGAADLRVDSRADATRAIDAVCAYLDAFEPANPAPLLLRRAQRLLDMSFLEAVADLAPGGLEQLRNLAGVGEGR